MDTVPKLVECLTDTQILLHPTKIIFYNFENVEGVGLLNASIMLAKQFIYAKRCLEKELEFYTFKDRSMEFIKIERQFVLKNKLN